MNKLITIGEPTFTRQDIINSIDTFLKLYNKRPIKNNNGGMKSPHCFATYFLLKYLNKLTIIESGVWKGQSTWLIENTCPLAKLICIEPILNRVEYISTKAQYTKYDWKYLNLNNTEDIIVFLDDHQNALERIKHAIKKGYKHLIFEDNYPTGQGDCLSLKQVFDKNNSESKYLYDNIEIYYEFPPIFTKKLTRWGDNWSNYPTQQPIFDNIINNEKYKKFLDEATDYTWIAYVKLK